MKNIIWQKSDGDLAVTCITDLVVDSALHAEHLQTLGAVPADWTVSAVNTSFAPTPAPIPPLQQIRAIEARPDVMDAAVKASRQLLLGTWFERVKAKPAAAGMSNEQIEAYCLANDKSYKALAEAEDAIKLLRAAV